MHQSLSSLESDRIGARCAHLHGILKAESSANPLAEDLCMAVMLNSLSALICFCDLENDKVN